MSGRVIVGHGHQQRRDRSAGGGLAVLAILVVATALLTLPLLQALLVAGCVVLALRLPVFRSRGTATLSTKADPDTVRADFESAVPPTLALQWGVADAIELTDEGETTVGVEWRSERRFGLRRLPQWFAAEHFRESALEAQDYRVVERDARLSF